MDHFQIVLIKDVLPSDLSGGESLDSSEVCEVLVISPYYDWIVMLQPSLC